MIDILMYDDGTWLTAHCTDCGRISAAVYGDNDDIEFIEQESTEHLAKVHNIT